MEEVINEVGDAGQLEVKGEVVTEDDSALKKASREAARYRNELRSVESERDIIKSELTRAQLELVRHIVDADKELQIGFQKPHPEAWGEVFPDGVRELFGDSGLDREKLLEQLSIVREEKPWLFHGDGTKSLVDVNQGKSPANNTSSDLFTNAVTGAFRKSA